MTFEIKMLLLARRPCACSKGRTQPNKLIEESKVTFFGNKQDYSGPL
jgi:hypothetical protein